MEIDVGYAVLTDRRFVVLQNEKTRRILITQSIPLDALQSCKIKKKGRAILSARTVDKRGALQNDFISIILNDLKNKNVKSTFDSKIEHLNSIISNLRNTFQNLDYPKKRELSYLELKPNPLTWNGILDLNTVLQDKPISDRLYHEAEKFLGNEPFLLEESLKDSTTIENGVLFAAGSKGYLWIQGKKNGRHMANVLVDKVEWENINYMAFQWQTKISAMLMNYSLQRGRSDKSVSYIWNPLLVETDLSYAWLFQQKNGPWIIADLMFKYSGQHLPACKIMNDKTKPRYYH
jgi:hypothetical protein